jgi:sulfonate transport system ATP-binding protein
MPPAIQLRDVCKIYTAGSTHTPALKNITLDIQPRDFVCIIGESGCGKSTLLQMIGGFEFPTEGEILANGSRILGPDHHRSIVFQESSLLPWLTAEENIRLGLEIRKQNHDSAARVAGFIRLIGLEGFERYYPAQLSGGMAQRVAIARALVNDPDVMLLDEPFGALDAFTRMRLQHELLRIWEEEQLTIVFVTHDIDEAIFLATRVVVMSARPGRISRTFNIALRHPRDRTSPEFIRLRGMIGKEFLALTQES